jgi:hypothetical protein
MPETTSNLEFAQRIHEQGHSGGGQHSRRGEWLEILEAVVLAAVAVLTAWSGYQAARWDARSAESYSRAASTTERAQEQRTLAGQERLYDITTFDSWSDAALRGDKKLAALFEHRFRPEYVVAFRAWMKTDPFQNPNAPAGPIFMPEYKSAKAEKGRQLSAEAAGHFENAVSSRSAGDQYVRITVVLATVLLLTALSQRFKVHGPRMGLLAVALVILGLGMYWILTFQRA